MSDGLVATLFEGDYVLGVGALANSLWAHGFRGEFVAGYRGELTHWAAAARPEGPGYLFDAGEGRQVRFVCLDTNWHLTNWKPYFLRDIWATGSAAPVFFFDPDIVIKARWSFFQEWVGYGLPLVADSVMTPMPADHPYRMAWAEWLVTRGYTVVRWPSDYYNGGFIGFGPDRRVDLNVWCRLHDEMAEIVPLDRMCPVPRTDLFSMTDQDTMNMLAMITSGPLSTMGPEGMDFVPGGTVMSHAANGAKPWRKRYLRSALGGVPPTLADKGWLTHTKCPIEVLSTAAYRRQTCEARLASVLGRFIRRV